MSNRSIPQVQAFPIRPAGFRVNSPANRRQQQHQPASSEFVSRAEFEQFAQEFRQRAQNTEIEAESSNDKRRRLKNKELTVIILNWNTLNITLN